MTNKEIDRLMTLRYRSVSLLHYDNIGTVRTGRDWFNRYMIHPWERSGFELADLDDAHAALMPRDGRIV